MKQRRRAGGHGGVRRRAMLCPMLCLLPPIERLLHYRIPALYMDSVFEYIWIPRSSLRTRILRSIVWSVVSDPTRTDPNRRGRE